MITLKTNDKNWHVGKNDNHKELQGTDMGSADLHHIKAYDLKHNYFQLSGEKHTDQPATWNPESDADDMFHLVRRDTDMKIYCCLLTSKNKMYPHTVSNLGSLGGKLLQKPSTTTKGANLRSLSGIRLILHWILNP